MPLHRSACQTCRRMGHPPRIPVWLRWEQNVIYFVTIYVANRKPVLANDTAFSAFYTAVAKLQEWTVLAPILMPDHLHAIVSPKDREIKVGNFSAALKRWIRQELGASWKWQPGSFDRLLAVGRILARQMAFRSRKPGPCRFRETVERMAVSNRIGWREQL